MKPIFAAVILLFALPALAHDPEPTPGRVPVRAGTDGRVLLSPPSADSFDFVIYGDRTGGPKSGVKILERAVEMTKALDPDFVMTVGDLIQGYGPAAPWLDEMAEYKEIMDGLDRPWYPVAGNHDVYARPSTSSGHEGLYKEHFGPLYYSFDHKFATFIVLYSDEAMGFRDPAKTQNMSPQQMAWLKQTLADSTAKQVFVFIHHPRWIAQYEGCNWGQVEQIFHDDGRPTTIVAGHIHLIRDDGQHGNIHYFAMGITGAWPADNADQAAFNHVNIVRVRPDKVTTAIIPIDAIKPGDWIKGTEMDSVRLLARSDWLAADGQIRVGMNAGDPSSVTLTLTNPADLPVELTVSLDVPSGWSFAQSRFAAALEPGESRSFTFNATSTPLGERRPDGEFVVYARYPLQNGAQQAVSRRLPLPIRAQVASGDSRAAADPADNGVLELSDGRSAVRVDLPESDAFTLEMWVKGDQPRGRTALATKTQKSGFGIFWSDDAGAEQGIPAGYVHAGGTYLTLPSANHEWDYTRWTHLALCFDGTTARLFVGGRLVSEQRAEGAYKPNRQPFYIGADPDKNGYPKSFFTGWIDEVRVSSVARYPGPFTPQRVFKPDNLTSVLYHFDTDLGAIIPDDSNKANHAWAVGNPEIVKVPIE